MWNDTPQIIGAGDRTLIGNHQLTFLLLFLKMTGPAAPLLPLRRPNIISISRPGWKGEPSWSIPPSDTRKRSSYIYLHRHCLIIFWYYFDRRAPRPPAKVKYTKKKTLIYYYKIYTLVLYFTSGGLDVGAWEMMR